MRLLLDEMHAREVAAQLRERGVDAVAVSERLEWRGLPDPDLLAVATAERRVLVTENVKDFAALARAWSAARRGHAGIVFTHPRRFPRGARGHVSRLTDALAAFVDREARDLGSADSFIWWLARP